MVNEAASVPPHIQFARWPTQWVTDLNFKPAICTHAHAVWLATKGGEQISEYGGMIFDSSY